MAQLESHEKDLAVYTTTISWDDFNAEADKVYRRTRGRYAIPGFRKGKAPRKIIEMNYGKIFYEDALNALLPDALDAAVKELELEAVGRPDVDLDTFEEKKDIVVKVTQATLPHPTLAEYKGVEVAYHSAQVADEEVDHVIEQEREKNAVMRPVERAAQNGDTVSIDYAGSIDGVAFDGGTAEKQTLVLGSGAFIPGFEEQIEGHTAGESFDVNVTFPEEYHAEDLKGKDAVFAVTLHEVQEKEMPELNDDFAQDVSEYDTFDEYRASIKEHLMEHAREHELVEKQNNAIKTLVNLSNIEPPQAMVEEQVDVEIRNFANQLQQMGISMEQYMQFGGASIEQLRENYEPAARDRVAGDLALGALAEEQGFEATEEEIDAEMKELAETYGSKDPEDFIKRMKEMHQEDLVADDVRKKKALDYLVEQVTFVEAKEDASEEAAEETGDAPDVNTTEEQADAPASEE